MGDVPRCRSNCRTEMPSSAAIPVGRSDESIGLHDVDRADVVPVAEAAPRLERDALLGAPLPERVVDHLIGDLGRRIAPMGGAD